MKEKEEQTSKSKVKSLGLWISIICILIMAVQVVLNLCGIQYEFKLIIEIVSYALALFVSMGLLSSSLKGKDVSEIKETIEQEIVQKINVDKEE